MCCGCNSIFPASAHLFVTLCFQGFVFCFWCFAWSVCSPSEPLPHCLYFDEIIITAVTHQIGTHCPFYNVLFCFLLESIFFSKSRIKTMYPPSHCYFFFFSCGSNSEVQTNICLKQSSTNPHKMCFKRCEGCVFSCYREHCNNTSLGRKLAPVPLYEFVLDRNHTVKATAFPCLHDSYSTKTSA